MSRFQHLHMDRDERDIVTVTFDVVGRPVNVFDENLIRELQAVVDDLDGDASVRLVVFRSAKESGFLAGADVHRIQEIATPREAESLSELGQELFQRVEALPTRTIAVIHGPCLGGGLEFALACTHRIARNDPVTRIGLPETQLGLLPAWGGTQRLPRVVGLTAAARMILQGRRLTVANAKQVGLLDAAPDPATFEEDVAMFVNDCLEGWRPSPASRGWLAWLRDETYLGQRLVLWFARRQFAEQAKQYPALPAALRAITAGLAKGMDAGLAKEREEFCRVLFTPTCRNLLTLFFQRERARKRGTWVAEGVESDPSIETIAVLGAGTMGAGIAQLAATQGYRVLLKDVDDATLEQGMQRIDMLTRQAVRKGVLSSSDAKHALASITPTTEMAPLAQVDLVIEAIVERLDVKQHVFRELDEQLPAKVLLVSNTSALPIRELAAATRRADRVAGLHFFNPVHKMPLVEVVRCPHTSDGTIASLVDVVRRLGKTPLVVAEGPGFLVNRILFPYLDEAVRMVGEGLPVEHVDLEAKRFGLPMGPLELLDAVGLDVANDVSHTLATLSLEQSPTPRRLADMVSAGHTGTKGGQGFYKYKHGQRRKPAAQGAASITTTQLPPPHKFAGETLSGVQQRLVFSLINSAADCLHEGIVTESWMVDLGMVLGTGFPPFRGGPLQLISNWGQTEVVQTLLQLSELCGPRFRTSDYFGRTPRPHAAIKQVLGSSQA